MERRSTSQNPNDGNGNRNGVLNPNQPCLCEECGQNPSKYKCPGCSLRTCSLPCVKSHKQRTSCTGKRPTTFVPLSEFNDNLLISGSYLSLNLSFYINLKHPLRLLLKLSSCLGYFCFSIFLSQSQVPTSPFLKLSSGVPFFSGCFLLPRLQISRGGKTDG